MSMRHIMYPYVSNISQWTHMSAKYLVEPTYVSFDISVYPCVSKISVHPYVSEVSH